MTSVLPRISGAIGHSISEVITRPGARPSYRLAELRPPHGFSVVVTEEANSVRAELTLDPLASDLRDTLSKSEAMERLDAVEAMRSFANMGNLARMRVNANDVKSAADFPRGSWASLEIWVAVPTIDSTLELALVDAVSLVMGMTLTLLGVGGDRRGAFDLEGERHRIEVNRYERSPANRAIAIAIGGYDCGICGFNFEKFYGPLAAGYIEVHHLTPVSVMDKPSVVDPFHDLICLCANCHRTVHRKSPPVAPEDLRVLLRAAGSKHVTGSG
ncbi:MAG: HNH endonuclease [Leifsonia sp.]|nr:HNH endonuclease [Leifsonia sp.]